MEYLVIVGLVLILIIPLTFLYIRYSTQSDYAIVVSKVDSISNQIVAAANQVSIYGAETQVRLTIDFPKNIKKIEFRGREIIFTILDTGNNENEIVKVSDVSISSKIYSTIVPGKKDVIVKSLGGSVEIIIMCGSNECPMSPPYPT